VSDDVTQSADHRRVANYEVLLDVGRTLAPLRAGNGDPTSAVHGETRSWTPRTAPVAAFGGSARGQPCRSAELCSAIPTR
jgi:hypothetical protein